MVVAGRLRFRSNQVARLPALTRVSQPLLARATILKGEDPANDAAKQLQVFTSLIAASTAERNKITDKTDSQSEKPTAEAGTSLQQDVTIRRGRKSEGSTADTARKRPERPWTAARTMEVLRRCPLAIAQRLVHCAIAVSTAVLGQSQGQCPLRGTTVEEKPEAKEVQLSQPSSTSLLMISSGLT